MSKFAKAPETTPESRDLVQWVWAILRGPTARNVYTLATLPDATMWNGTTLPISDGAGGLPTVTAIGGNWTYPDGTTV